LMFLGSVRRPFPGRRQSNKLAMFLKSRPAYAELLTHKPHLLPTGIRIHRVFEPISESSAWIPTESRIE
jgi:hypothetical protein